MGRLSFTPGTDAEGRYYECSPARALSTSA